MMDEITLGCEVEDLVSGFRGIATGRIEYMNGCVQYSVKPKLDKDGKVLAAEWFDVQSLRRVGDGITQVRRDTGGPDANAAPLPSL